MDRCLGAALAEGLNMRIVVDLNRCQGYAQCVPLAPDVFKLLGDEALVYDPNPEESQRQRVARAVASCPVQAILLELDPPEDRATRRAPNRSSPSWCQHLRPRRGS